MKASDFKKLDEAFNAALPLDGKAREAAVAALADKNPALAKRLQAMLNASEQTHDAVEGVVREAVASTERLPDNIGPFEVLKRLGHGGMGVVFLCRRSGSDFEQLLAVKRLNTAIDSDFARQRMRIERQVLASLRHPNIAQLIDGGEDDQGVPYVAMEFVDGVSVDEYVVREKLDIEQRVSLFLSLCEAVQFAHSNSVIHRDIKADNVQIDQHGRLKLLDFGIAKLQAESDSAGSPMTVAAVMTPHYASPEQVRGEPSSQVSDIYSMGVLLYELIAGNRPYQFTTTRPSDVERVVCQFLPSPPLASANARQQDLNCIVMKALHKQADRRYQSVAQLADDLNRWLQRRPVLAQPDSTAYRLSVFARRHPFGVGATALIVALLIGFSSTMAWQARQLAQQRDVAQRQAAVANETTDFLIELFAHSDPREGDPSKLSAGDLLEAAAGRLNEEFTTAPLTRAQLLHVVGLAFANLGDDQRGTEMLTQALVLREQYADPAGPELSDTLNRLGNIHRRFGRPRQAEPLLLRALDIREQQGVVDHDLADSYNNVGLLENELGQYAYAEQLLRKSIAMHRQAGGVDTIRVTAPLHNLSLSLRNQDRLQEALAASTEALEIKRANNWNSSSLANTLAAMANLQLDLGQIDSALQLSTESLALREDVFGRDNPMMASGLATHARVLAAMDDAAAAESLFREALALHQQEGTEETLRVADLQLSLAEFLRQRGRNDEARVYFELAATIARRQLPADSHELSRFIQPD